MKKILLGLAICFAVSLDAFAGNGYCDSRPSNRERQNCYESGVEAHVSQIKQSLQYLMRSPKLTQQQKQQLQQEQSAWFDKVGRYCNDNVVCLHDAAVERSSYLARQVRNN